MKKILPIIIVSILIVGGGAFYGGMKYGENKSASGSFSRQNFQNLSAEDRQQLFQGNAAGTFQRGMVSNSLYGEVVSSDEQSLTLKTPDGSSRIIFFSVSTEISKTAEGSITDIEIGKQITVSGDQNSDGSYTAKTIQLSPR